MYLRSSILSLSIFCLRIKSGISNWEATQYPKWKQATRKIPTGLHGTQNSIALITRVRVFWSISDKIFFFSISHSLGGFWGSKLCHFLKRFSLCQQHSEGVEGRKVTFTGAYGSPRSVLLRLPEEKAPQVRTRLCKDNINPLKPNGPYRGRNAPLTSKVAFYIFIQQI